MIIEIAGHDVSDSRCETLSLALAAGADEATLLALRDAVRVARTPSIVLPRHRYESCSHGRGWARKGQGDNATWGERVKDGYRVGPGTWSVGATDGFARKASTEWYVSHVQVGSQTWTIAN